MLEALLNMFPKIRSGNALTPEETEIAHTTLEELLNLDPNTDWSTCKR